ncbi:MAG TPA: DegV family protein [Bacillota bacterium]|nr:DegV family protein [Bacillota bacterium]
MSRIRIVTDSTADLPKELVEKNEITVVPLKVTFQGEEAFLDGVNIDSEQFYRLLSEKKEIPVTSQPSPSEFAAVYKKLAQDGYSVISIHISSKMSGTFQSAIMGKKMVPGADIEVIDSKLVSMGLGMVVLEAAIAAKKGKTGREIVQIVNNLIAKSEVFFFVDTLEYLSRGGRIGKAGAFLGTILNIKPLLCIKDGIVYPYEKVRGRTKAIERMIQIVEERFGNRRVKCSLVHGDDPEGLSQLFQKIKTRLNCGEPVVSTAGSVVGTHAGPKVLGIILAHE